MKRKYTILAILVSVWALLSPISINAATHTISDGTITNDKIPFDGFNLDATSQQSQFIILADQITPLLNNSINALTFYLSSTVEKDYTSITTVSMGATSLSSLSTSLSSDATTACFTGNLSVTGTTATITFSEPYIYTGGNLLVNFSSTKGNYQKTTFLGTTTTDNLSANKKGTSAATFYAFQPKTTFEFEPPIVGPALRTANTLDFSYIKATSSETKQLVVRNIGSETLTINSIEGIAAPFSIASTTTFPIQIASKDSYTLDLSFSPTTKCNLTQQITFKSNSADASTLLTGSAYPETAHFESFENTLWGSSPYQTAGWRHRFSASVSYGRLAAGGFDNKAYINHSTARNYGDTLVTPKTSGRISYWGKTQNSGGTIAVLITQDFKTWRALTTNPTTALSSTWRQYEVTDIPENSYVGFVLSNACLDEVFMEEATIPTKDLELTTISTIVYGVNEGTSTSLKFSAYNWGVTPIAAADYSFEIRTTCGKLLQTIPATTDIPANGKIDITSSWVYTLDEKVPTTYDVYVKAIYAEDEDVSNNNTYTKRVTVTPLIGSLKLINCGTQTAPRDFGYLAGPTASRTLSFKLENFGITPLLLSNLSIKAPFTCDTTFPITLDAKGSSGATRTINITLQGAVGEYNDSIEITNDGIASNDNKIYLKGVVDPQGYLLESFQQNEFPPIHWESRNTDPILTWKREVNGSYTNAYQTSGAVTNIDSCFVSSAAGDTLITPKMQIKSGESLKYYLKYTASSGTSYLKVFFSSDKTNWNKIDSIGKSELTDKFVLFNSTLALNDNSEGWFAFLGEGVNLDMVRGYQIVVNQKDPGIVDLRSTAEKHTANYESSFTVTVRNFGMNRLNHGDYSVVLKADNVELARQAGIALEPTAFGEMRFNHLFNTAGLRNITATLEMSDDENGLNNTSEVLPMMIHPEESETLIEIGECASTTTNAIPSSNYKNAGIKSIYSAQDLVDLKVGMKIDSLYIPYFSTITYNGYVQAWIGESSEQVGSLANIFDVTDMTHMTGEKIITGGSSSSPQYLKYKLSTPIVYNGGNLCVILALDSTSYKSGVTFFKQTTTDIQSINYAKDATTKLVAPATFGDLSVQATHKTQNYLLAIRLKAERPAPYIGGFVRDGNSQPIENAVVNFSVGQVNYSTTTSSSGYYEMQIFQSEQTFNVSVLKEGFTPYSEAFAVGAESMTHNITLSPEATTDVTDRETHTLQVVTLPNYHYLVVSDNTPESISVYTTTGQLIEQHYASQSINLEPYSSGTYLLVIHTNRETHVVKVIR